MPNPSTPAPSLPEPKTCEHPGCPVRFIPKSKNHVFCSYTCKKRSHAYRFALGRK